MTSTTGTIGHPDVSEISDLTEGLLSPSRTAEIRRHLTDCALCADVRTSLEEIRGLLGTLPGPVRMPVDIAGRIDAALAAEALLDRTAPPAAPSEAEPAPASAHVSRETSRTVPVAPAGHAPAATGPGRTRRRARRRIAALSGLAAAAACVLGLFLAGALPTTENGSQSARKDAGAATAAEPRVAGSPEGTAFTAQGLEGSVRVLLTGPPPQRKPGENTPYGMENTGPGLAPSEDRRAEGIPACVQDATGRAQEPLASERGTYQGTPVYLVVLPHPVDAGRVDAFLIDSTCETIPGTAAGAPLLTATYSRP
ncbi:hypothetical protein [Streptomyces sp. NPDC012888]|uniref:hypothetical protein n=1 Tax=Streptomyces sp. NPDC012888 TaxID=3364855 RepID=UPI00367F213B